MPTANSRRPQQQQQHGPPPDLDKLVEQALQNAGNKGTQSYENFRESFPSLSDPTQAGSDEDEGGPATAGRTPAGVPGISLQMESREDALRREYEEAADSEDDDGEAPRGDALQVEELDEDGLVVEKLSRTSSGGFFLDGPGNLQFNNFTLDSDDDNELDAEKEDEEEIEESTYVPSSVQRGAEAASPATSCSSASAAQVVPSMAPEQEQLGDVLDGDSIHRSLHGHRHAPPALAVAAASVNGTSDHRGAASGDALSSGAISGGDLLKELAHPPSASCTVEEQSSVLSASFPEAVPGMAGADDDKWVEPTEILTDADHFIQSLPMESRRPEPLLNPDVTPRQPPEEPQPSLSVPPEEQPTDPLTNEDPEDAVIPFKLDSTFDYDNCKLTPKPWPWDPNGPRPPE